MNFNPGGYWAGTADEAPDAGLFADLGLGRGQDVEVLSHDFRVTAVLTELGDYRKKQASAGLRNDSVLQLQTIVRGWLARKRYLAHKKQLTGLLERLKNDRECDAATSCQKTIRGFLARSALRRHREDLARRREEDGKKRKKNAKKSKKLIALPPDLPHVQRLLILEEGFLIGWDLFVEATNDSMKKVVEPRKLDECIKVWEKHKTNQDKVTLRMLELAHRLK